MDIPDVMGHNTNALSFSFISNKYSDPEKKQELKINK